MLKIVGYTIPYSGILFILHILPNVVGYNKLILILNTEELLRGIVAILFYDFTSSQLPTDGGD